MTSQFSPAPGLLLPVAIAIAALSAPAIAGIPSFHATLPGDAVEQVFPGVEFPSSTARGLNENGDLIGESLLNWTPETGSVMRAFVLTVEHGVVALPLLSGWPSTAVTDVSDRDANGEIIIVGGGVPGPYVDLYVGEAALWRYSTVTGEVLETRALGIPAGFGESFAVAVSNSGTIVGHTEVIGPYTNWKYDIAADVLETFDFPARVADMNNLGQVCGGSYRGDLFGNWEDLSDTYEPGDVMPDWAIENGGISAAFRRINDQGWLVGRAGTGISDGAGHFLVAIVRFADPIGWTGMPPVSHLSLAGGINDQGDFTDRTGGAYLESTGQLHALNTLVAPEFQPLMSVSSSPEINNNRQVAGDQAHVFLLTPLGEMIVPGDVNGDVSVNLDDHCAWVSSPTDLDGDGDADAADLEWLNDRLAVFGFVVEDCDGNGTADHCEIETGLADCDGNGVPDGCQPDCSGDGVPDVCESDCNGNGVPDGCDIAAFTSLDCNENGIPDECDQGGMTNVLVQNDPPLFMYQDDVIVQEVLVTDAGIVDDVDVILDYVYRIGLTKVELSHAGTTVTIVDRPGHPLHTNGFVNFGYDAYVDDDAGGPFLEDTGDYCCSFETLLSPPYYRPNEPLSAFDGLPSEGVWTFTLTTTPDFSNGDGLHGWGLRIRRASAAGAVCDCNDNSVADEQDISGGTSADANGNGVPDECESMPGDTNGDSAVDVDDLLRVILAWGPCPAAPSTCDEDVTGDNVVSVDDLVMVITHWGW